MKRILKLELPQKMQSTTRQHDPSQKEVVGEKIGR